jgi:branched-chain amino acid transport system substrate-binding protein
VDHPGSLSTYGDILIFGGAGEGAPPTAASPSSAPWTPPRAGEVLPGGRVKFDENGRRVGADVVVVQWQNGVPVTVYPPGSALAQPIWPKQ